MDIQLLTLGTLWKIKFVVLVEILYRRDLREPCIYKPKDSKMEDS